MILQMVVTDELYGALYDAISDWHARRGINPHWCEPEEMFQEAWKYISTRYAEQNEAFKIDKYVYTINRMRALRKFSEKLRKGIE